MTPSIKRRLKPNARPKKHKEQLIDTPLDVLIEIFSFLEPLDLLHLARTTKGLREFLLSRRKSSTLWKNAINNLEGFPPCPGYMSAPTYTHLAFVPVCHGCFCLCETIEWELRMRCCPDCFPKMTIPRYAISHNKAEVYLTGLDLPVARHHYELNYERGLDVMVCLESVKWIYSFSLLDWKVVQSRKRPKGADSLEAFLAEQNELWGSVRRHARLCRDWECRRLQEQAAQLSLVRRKRVEDIKARFKESGWEEADLALCYGSTFLRLPEVRKVEPLTPTEWIEIRPQLDSWMQKAKEESVCNYRMGVYDTTFLNIHQELSSDTSVKVRPLLIDIAVLPAVRSAVEDNINTDISRDDLKKKFTRLLPPAIRKWSSTAVKELEQLARAQLGLPPLSRPSCLPSVIFRCKVCHRRLRFDEALSHEHLYKEKCKEYKDMCKMSTYDRLLMGYSSHPRNIRVLRVDVPVSRRVENLVKRIGKNPSRVMYNELRHSTVNVVCGLCRPEVAVRMNFEGALEHCLKTHLGKKETEVWTRALARK